MKEKHPAIEIMTSAAAEIRELRRQNEILRAKVEVMDFFALVLHTQPASRSQGASIDVAWQLDKQIADMQTGPVQP